MLLKGKKVLITGADGFIGSHLTERCIALGAKVKAFTYYNSFGQWGWLDTVAKKTLDRHEIISGDVRDFGCVRQACEGVDIVFHLAALISIPYSYQSPESFVATNINGTMNILQSARMEKVSQVIITSTSEVYGTAQQVPIGESHPINPQSPYAATKSSADSLALSFYRSFDVPVKILRPFNTFGPRQSARAVIPTIITQILAGQKTIKLGNVQATRDLNYVGNTVDAFIQLACADKGFGEVYNAGTSVEVSVLEVANTVQKILERRVKIVLDRQRLRPVKSEVERLVCDYQKLKNLTGWVPKINLEQGLAKTCTWLKEHQHHYKTDVYHV